MDETILCLVVNCLYAITKHISLKVSQMEHFKCEFVRGYEKNMSFLVIPHQNLQKVNKKTDWKYLTGLLESFKTTHANWWHSWIIMYKLYKIMVMCITKATGPILKNLSAFLFVLYSYTSTSTALRMQVFLQGWIITVNLCKHGLCNMLNMKVCYVELKSGSFSKNYP